MTTILKKKSTVHIDEVLYDLQTVTDSIKYMDDLALYDSCMFDIQEYQRHDLDALYDKLALGGKLSPEERKQVEAFYILTNIDFLVHE